MKLKLFRRKTVEAPESRASLENPSTSLANPAAWLSAALGATDPVASGVSVNEKTSIQVSAVYACVRVLAESIAMLPLQVFRRLDGGGRELAREHPLNRLLHERPSRFHTSYEWRQLVVTHQALYGNAYSFVRREASTRRPIELLPLMPEEVEPERRGGETFYVWRPQIGDEVVIPAEDMLHYRALSMDGLKGLSPIRVAREAVGLSRATERFGARFFGSGSHPTGVLEHPESFSSDEIQQRVARSWQDAYGGLDQSHRIAILEEGLKFKPITIPPEDAQFLQTRKFQVEEIARLFRVPQHLVGHLDRATFNNIEQLDIGLVKYTLMPWMVMHEQAINETLLRADERESLFCSYNADAVLRGDSESRSKFYRELWQIGAITANEIRARENLNPVEDGDRRFVPLNMVPADLVDDVLTAKAASEGGGSSGSDQQGETSNDDDEADDRDDGDENEERTAAIETRAMRSVSARVVIQSSHERLFKGAGQAVIRREGERLVKHLRKTGSKDELLEFIRGFYEEVQPFIIRQFTDPMLSLAETIQAEAAREVGAPVGLSPEMEGFVDEYLRSMAIGYAANSANQLRSIISSHDFGDELAENIVQKVEDWHASRADRFARRQTREAGAAIAKRVYVGAGITLLRWVTVGDNCPYCEAMAGRVIGIDEPFLRKGQALLAGDSPLVPRHDIGHPPLHRGCDCQIAAESEG